MGDPRKDGSIPAWVFYIIEPQMIESLKGAIMKAIFETNHQKLQKEVGKQSDDKSSKSDSSVDMGADTQWLESTIIADRQDVDSVMDNGNEVVEEYDFDLNEDDGDK